MSSRSYLIRRLTSIVVVLVALASAAAASPWQLQAGTTTLPATTAASSYQAVMFATPFAAIPVVVVMPSGEGDSPASLRVRDVTAAGFELVQVEAPAADGPHEAMTVDWIAIDDGLHQLRDGTLLEAGRATVSDVQYGSGVTGSESWYQLSFAAGFAAAPAVLASLQTDANETAPVPSSPPEPWLVVGLQAVTPAGAQLALERGEAAAGEVSAAETVGWLAIESGAQGALLADDAGAVTYQAIVTDDAIAGWDNGCVAVPLTAGFSSPPLVVAHLDRHDGGDGGWLRRCGVAADSVSLTVDEDTFRDTERSHTAEAAGLVAISRPFTATVDPAVPAVALAAAAVGVDESSGSVELVVELSAVAPGDVSVAWATADGTAVAGSDYVAAAGAATIESGQQATSITIAILDDSASEPAESFTVSLGSPAGAILGWPSATVVTIAAGDTAGGIWTMAAGTAQLPAVTAGSPFQAVAFDEPFATAPVVVVMPTAEGDEPAALRVRGVTAAGFELVQVEAAAADGPHDAMAVDWLAVTPGSHELPDGTLLEAGLASTASVQHGSDVAGAESWYELSFSAGFATVPALLASLQSDVNETAAVPQAPPEPWLVVGVQAVTTAGAQLALERGEAAPGAVGAPETVGWLAIEASAGGGFMADDGAAVSYQVELSGDVIAGWDNGCVELPLAAGFAIPPLVIAHLNRHDGGDGGWLRRCGVAADSVALVVDEDTYRDSERAHTTEAAGLVAVSRPFTLTLDPTVPVVQLADAAVVAGEAAGTLELSLNLSTLAAGDVTVAWTTADGTASAGADYVAAAGSATIVSGQQAATITLDLLDDAVFEGDESFSVMLSSATGADLGVPASATVTLSDDEPEPAVAWTAATATVGEDAGAVSLELALSGPAAGVSTVQWATADGGAVGGADFAAAVGTATFAALVTTASVTIPVLDDSLAEPDEDLSVVLTSPTGCVLGAPAALAVTIPANDAPGTTWALAAGSVSLPATGVGSSLESVAFDQPFEAAPVVVVMPSAEGDQPAAVRVHNVTTAGFELVQVEAPAADGPHEAMSVDWIAATPGVHQLADGTLLEAGLTPVATIQHGSDVSGAESWSELSFAAGFATSPAFLASLQSAHNETAAIPEAPPEPWLVVGVQAVSASGAQLALERGEAAAGTVSAPETVGWLAIASGTSGSLVADDAGVVSYETRITSDTIVGWDNGCVSLPLAAAFAGPPLLVAHLGRHDGGDGGWLRRCDVTATTVSLVVDEDTYRDSERAHTAEAAGVVAFSRPFEASYDNAPALPTVQLATESLSAGEAAAAVDLTVTLSEVASTDVTVHWATVNGTTEGNADYVVVSEDLVIPAGEVSGVVTVDLVDDAVFEGDESFGVMLTNPIGADLGAPATTTITLIDDETEPAVSWAAATTAVGEDTGITQVELTLSGPSEAVATVAWATADDTALAGEDYVAASGVATFASLATTATVPLEILDDTVDESDEALSIILTSPSGAELGSPSTVMVTILDDDSSGPAQRIAYSVSADMGNQLAGPIQVAISAGVATFIGDSWSTYPKRGQRLTYDGTVAYVQDCPGDTSCDVVMADGSLPPDTVAVDVESIHNVFSSLAAGVTGAGSLLGTTDLVAANLELELVTRGDAADTAPVEVTGWSTGPAHRLVLSAAPEDRHDGRWSEDAYRLEVVGAPACITSTIGDLVLDGLQIHCSDDPANDVAGVLLDGAAVSGTVEIAGCLIRLDDAVGAGDRLGIAAAAVSDLELRVRNTMLWDLGGGSARHAGILAEDDSVTTRVASTTIHGGTFGLRQLAGSVTALDVLAVGATTADFSGAFDPASRGNVSSDGTAPGSAATPDAAGVFAGDTGGAAADLHLECDITGLATITSSPIDIGPIANLFDGDPLNIVRSAAVNPMFVQLELDEPVTLTASSLAAGYNFDGNSWRVAMADSAADMASESGSYQVVVPWRVAIPGIYIDPGFVWDEAVLETPASGRVIRLEVDKVNSGPFDYIHLGEWHLELGGTPCGGGTDLTADPVMPFGFDVDGQVRTAPWDAGADEATTPDVEPVVFVTQVWEEEGVARVQVALSEPAASPLELSYRTVDLGFATAGEDFVATTGTALVPAGSAHALLTIPIVSDAISDDWETFGLEMAPTGVDLARGGSAEVVIRDGAAPVQLHFATDRVSVAEDAGSATLTVVLSAVAGHDVVVHWEANDVSAKLALDYGQVHGDLVIPAGQLSGEIAVPIYDDTSDEPSESLKVTLYETGDAWLAAPRVAEIEIVDDDQPSIALTGAVFSASEAAGSATITVSLPGATDHDVAADWELDDGIAVAGDDYIPAAGTVVVPAGELVAGFDVALVDDDLAEPDETVLVSLSNASGGTLGSPSSAVLTIHDDDAPIEVAFSLAAVSVAESAGTVTLTVELSEISDEDVVVQVATADDSAFAPDDYLALSAPVTVSAGELSAQVTVTLVDDGLYEPDETFDLVLSGPTGAVLGSPDTATVTILTSDAPPEVSFASSVVVAVGTDAAVSLTIELSAVTGDDVAVQVATADGSAVAPADYLALTGPVTIPAGELSAAVTIAIVDDATTEPAESFSVALSAPTGATLGAPSLATVTILDDAAPPAQTIAYSVCADTDDQLGGPVQVAISGGVASFIGDSWSIYPQRGQRLTYDGGSVVYLQDCVSDTSCEVVTADGGLPPDTDPVDVDSARHEFASLAAALAGAGALLGTTDLVTADRELELLCYEGGAPDTSAVDLSGWTTGPGRRIVLRAAAEGRHEGSWSEDAYRLEVAGAPACITSPIGNLVLDGLQLHCGDDPANDVAGILLDGAAVSGTVEVDGCLIRLDDASGAGDRLGIAAPAVGDLELLIRNTMLWDLGDGGARHAGLLAEDDSVTTRIASTTIHGGSFGIRRVAGLVTALDVLAVGATSADFDGAFEPGSRGNASSDGAAPGIGTTHQVASVFAGATSGASADLHLECDIRNLATITSSTIDIGSVNNLFDGDPLSIVRSANVNPMFVQLELAQPVGLTSSSIASGYSYTGNRWRVMMADSAADMASESGSYRVVVPWRVNAPATYIDPGFSWDEAALALAETGRVVRLEVEKLNSDSYVHVGEWRLELTGTACRAGADLSADPVMPFADDVDGDGRTPPWDTGADEATTPAITLVSSSGYVYEADGEAVLQLKLSETAVDDLQLVYRTLDTGSATPGVDFAPTGGSVVVPAGASYFTLTIPVADDGVSDDWESFGLQVGPAGTDLDRVSYLLVRIRDGVPPLRVRFAADRVTVDESAGSATLQVVLDAVAGSDVTVNWEADDVSAQLALDYGQVHGDLTIPAGELGGEISVPIYDDGDDEPPESLKVTLRSASGATLAAPRVAEIAIVDDDEPAIGFSSASFSAEEGDGAASITVRLAVATDHDMSAVWSLADGTAVAGLDYQPATGTVTIAAGETGASFDVTLVDDQVAEPSETVLLSLASPLGGVLGSPAEATLTILDDDTVAAVSLATAGVAVAETVGVVDLTVELSAVVGQDVTVQVATADGGAIAPDDYVAIAGPATIAAGELSTTVSVTIVDDLAEEGAESFTVALTDPTGATLGDPSTATVTILASDGPPSVSFAAASTDAMESAGAVTLTVALSATYGADVEALVATVDGSATAPADYVALSGVVTIPSGDLTAPVTITLVDDADQEPDETFDVVLSSPVGAVLGAPATATVTILANDAPNVVSMAVASLEIDEHGGSVALGVELAVPAQGGESVLVTTTGGAAESGVDFEPIATTVTFDPGQQTATVDVVPIDETDYEPAEDFTVGLSQPGSGVVLGAPSSTTVTIRHSDWPPAVYFPDGGTPVARYGAVETEGQLVLTVRLSARSAYETRVDYATSDASAVAGEDYLAASGTLVFDPGETERPVVIQILDDGVPDDGELFAVTLSNPVNCNLDGSGNQLWEAEVTIYDDLSVSFASPTAQVEPPSTWVRLAVPLSHVATTDVRLLYTTHDGTATAGEDYVAESGELVIEAGQAYGVIVITLISGDPEPPEMFTVDLSAPLGAALVAPDTVEVWITASYAVYQAKVVHADSRVVHLDWERTYYTASVDLERRDADLGGDFVVVTTLDEGPQTFWRDFDVAPGDRWEYRLVPRDASGVAWPATIVALESPLTEDDSSPTAVVPGMAAVVPGSGSAPPEAHLFAGVHDYLFTLTPDPDPEFIGCTVDVYVDELPATADPDEPSQPLESPFFGASRDDLNCMGATGAPGVSDVACDGPTCQVTVPALAPGIHRFRFVLTDAGGLTSERAIVQDLQPWWPVNATTASDYPAAFPLLFGDRLGAGAATVRLQGAGFVGVADSQDCADWAEPGAVEVLGQPYVLDAAGQAEVVITGIVQDATVDLSTAPSGDRVIGRELLHAGSLSATWGGLQTVTPTTWSGAAIGDLTAGSDVAPVVDAVLPYVADESTATELAATVWVRVVDPDQDVDVTSVTVGNLTRDGGTELSPAYYADPSLQLRPEGDYGWLVATVTLLEGSNQLTIHAADLAGHEVDETGFSVERTVLVPGSYPVPVIGFPTDGLVYYHQFPLDLDGTPSTVPADHDVWFGVLVDDGSEPMTEAFSTDQLVSSFVTDTGSPGYRVRLVVAAPGAMPDASLLRAPALPCSLMSSGGACDSTEVRVTGFESTSGPQGFGVTYALPEGVFLTWPGSPTMTIERSDDGGATWLPLGQSPEANYFDDQAVTEGAVYNYRARIHNTAPWAYLGGTLRAPGGSVTIPVWAAPQVLPIFDSVTWLCPAGASKFFCEGELELTLEAEPGGSLAGSVVQVYLNEETYQLADGTGEKLPVDFPYGLTHFEGGDLPGCVVRKATPDLEVTFAADQETRSVTLPGVAYGANSLRFVVVTNDGETSERALLVALHSQPLFDGPSITYPLFMPLLFGDVIGSPSGLSPVPVSISGYGPVGRHSPDCRDGDLTYGFYHYPDYGHTDGLYFDWFGLQAHDNVLVETDADGHWVWDPYELADGTYNFWIGGTNSHPDWQGFVGRALPVPDGRYPDGRYFGKVYSAGWTGNTSLVVDSTVTDFTPHLDYLEPSVLVDSAEPEASAEIRFRITDADHDVELDSIEITNTSVSPPALAYGFPGHWQGWPQGRWGWFVAELPLAPGDNDLVFCAHDAAGNVFGTVEEPCVTATVTRESPLVEARITAPDPSVGHSYAPGALITLDGSTSLAPPGGVAVWALAGVLYGFFPSQQTSPTSDFAELRRTYSMTDHWPIRARLIVAVDEAHLPADYWTTELPCQRSDGEGLCDSAEVTLGRGCTIDHSYTTVVIDQPAEGISVGFNEAFDLLAHVESPALDPFAYRWTVHAASDPWRYWPLATIGADDEGQGFSVANDSLTVTAAGQSLPAGDYLLTAEARYPAAGCSSPGWYWGYSNAVALHVGHTFDGVAPGQVVEGAPFRVYSRSLAVGQLGYVEVDDDPHDATPGLVYSGLVQSGGYVEVAPGVGEVPASGSPWALRVSADSDFTASSPQLVDTFMVEPAGSVDVPLLVTNEESVACGGADSECIHDLLPGQTWQGEWDRPGDVDWYAFSVGAGAEVSVTVDRVDTSLPPLHPDAPAPEIYLYRPDEVLVDRSEPLGLEATGASLAATVTLGGRQLVGVATPKGSGAYLVRVTVTAEGGSGDAAIGYTADRVHLTTNVRPETTFGAPVFDAFGNPMAGSVVSWDGGTDCGDGTFCPSGATASTRSSANGYGTLHWQPGADPLWRPTPELAAAGKAAAVDRTEVGKRLDRARGLERALGYARTSGGAVLSADLVDMETVKMVRREAQRTWRPVADGQAKDGPLCPDHPESCDGGGAPVFEAAQITLGDGEDLVDVVVRIMDGGSEIEELDGQPILSDVPLTVEVEATISTASGDRTETIAGPVALAVSEKLGASVQSGSATCSVVRHEGGGFTYKVGRQSSLNYLYDDLQGEPCCWQATEYLSAKIVVDAEVLDDQGDPQRVTKEASSVVRSLPRPLEPCEIRNELHDNPELPGWEGTELGTIYTTDLCGNVVNGIGVDDSAGHTQPGDELYVSLAGPPPTDPVLVVGAVEHNPESSMFVLAMSADPDDPGSDEMIPPGSYAVHVEVASTSPECSSAGTISAEYPFTISAHVPLVYPDLPTLAENLIGSYPELVTPGTTMRDTKTGQVVMWRATAESFDFEPPSGNTEYEHVPVKAYLVDRSVVPVDWDGDVRVDEYFEPVADAELCTGTIYRQADGAGNVFYGSPARMECDTVWGATADLEASSERLDDLNGAPDSWVAAGNGVGVLKTPSQPGTYRLVLEPLDEAFRRGDNWRMRHTSQNWDVYSREIVVGGGMFLDENYRHTQRYIVREPVQGFLLLRSADLPLGTNQVGITSRDQNAQPISEGIQVDLVPVAGGSSLIGPIALYPAGYDAGKHSAGGKVLLDGPRVDVGVGDGLINAFLLTKQSAGALGQCACNRPGQLEVRFLAPDGSGTGYVYSPTQATEIGGPAENWAEIVPMEIAAVDPYSTLPADDPGRIQRCSEDVELIEHGNSQYTVASRLVYHDLNLERGGTYLLPDGSVQQPEDAQPGFLSLVDGVARLELRAVKEAPLRVQPPPNEPNEEANFPFTTGIQALSAMSAATQLSPSEVKDVAQFVDEASYNRRRNNPNPQDLWTTGPNQIRDWLERKWWDFLTDTSSQNDSELESILAGATSLAEDNLMLSPGKAELDGATVTVRASSTQVRADTSPFVRYGYLQSFPQPNPSPFNYFFRLIVIHESRHLWQYRWISGPERDQDNDQLCNDVPASGNEFLDSNYVAAGGDNRDFYFMGDDQSASSHDDYVSLAFERDALRYASTVCGVPYICALESPPRLEEVVQGQPSTVYVVTEQTEGTQTFRVGGVSIRWTVEGAGCEPICQDPRTPPGSPCYTTSVSTYGTPNEGVAYLQVFNFEGGDCTVRYSITVADSPPQGPPGTVDCVGVGAEGSTVINFQKAGEE